MGQLKAAYRHFMLRPRGLLSLESASISLTCIKQM